MFFSLQEKKVLTPTRNRVYSRVYRQIMAKGEDVAMARMKAKEECDRQGL
jgi:hypothetical protein